LDAEAGVKLRSPKGCAAAHGLDACIRVQHPFMPAGDTSHPNQINPIKNPLDSEHGIYRDHTAPGCAYSPGHSLSCWSSAFASSRSGVSKPSVNQP